MKTDLQTIETMDPAVLFAPKKLDELLGAIKTEFTAEVPDIDSARGRDRIKSLAHQVARSKTTLDGVGKDHVAQQKASIAEIDAQRRKAREFLDALKEEVRKPLTDWEEKEAARISKIQGKIDAIRLIEDDTQTSEALKEKLSAVQATKITKAFAEYQTEAENVKNATIVALMETIQLVEAQEKEAADLARLREEEVKQQAAERDKQIAEQAVKDAEIKAKRELEARDAAEAREKAEQERRERDTRHKGATNRAAAEAIVKVNPSCDEVLAKQIVKSIVQGKIPNVTINY